MKDEIIAQEPIADSSIVENLSDAQQEAEQQADTEPQEQQTFNTEVEEGKDPPRALKRINKLTARLKNTEEENNRLREELIKRQFETQKYVDPMTGQHIETPNIKDYADHNGNLTVEGFTKYEQDMRMVGDKIQKAEGFLRLKQSEESRLQSRMQIIRNQAEDLSDKYDDFSQHYSQAARSFPPQADAAAQAIFDSEKGAEILYYLGKNPGEAQKIFGLSPIAQAKEIGRIEASLTAPKKIQSKAPAPLSQQVTNGATGKKRLEEMSIKELEAYYKKSRY